MSREDALQLGAAFGQSMGARPEQAGVQPSIARGNIAQEQAHLPALPHPYQLLPPPADGPAVQQNPLLGGPRFAGWELPAVGMAAPQLAFAYQPPRIEVSTPTPPAASLHAVVAPKEPVVAASKAKEQLPPDQARRKLVCCCPCERKKLASRNSDIVTPVLEALLEKG